jgi:hypothetical protein
VNAIAGIARLTPLVSFTEAIARGRNEAGNDEIMKALSRIGLIAAIALCHNVALSNHTDYDTDDLLLQLELKVIAAEEAVKAEWDQKALNAVAAYEASDADDKELAREKMKLVVVQAEQAILTARREKERVQREIGVVRAQVSRSIEIMISNLRN